MLMLDLKSVVLSDGVATPTKLGEGFWVNETNMRTVSTYAQTQELTFQLNLVPCQWFM
jgi:hypothetical protein